MAYCTWHSGDGSSICGKAASHCASFPTKHFCTEHLLVAIRDTAQDIEDLEYKLKDKKESLSRLIFASKR